LAGARPTDTTFGGRPADQHRPKRAPGPTSTHNLPPTWQVLQHAADTTILVDNARRTPPTKKRKKHRCFAVSLYPQPPPTY